MKIFQSKECFILFLTGCENIPSKQRPSRNAETVEFSQQEKKLKTVKAQPHTLFVSFNRRLADVNRYFEIHDWIEIFHELPIEYFLF